MTLKKKNKLGYERKINYLIIKDQYHIESITKRGWKTITDEFINRIDTMMYRLAKVTYINHNNLKNP